MKTRTAGGGLLLLLVSCMSSWAEDLVYLRPRELGQEAVCHAGRVLDANGRLVRLLGDEGRIRTFPAGRVLRIDGEWLDPHRQGNRAIEKGEFAAAISAYRQALDRESRPWVRREILARLVACRSAAGHFPSAAAAFFELIRSDPTSPHFAQIPLAWSDAATVPADRGVRWLERLEDPVHVLLGASHLLASERRALGIRALESLVEHKDPRVAALAEAQLWRTEGNTATLLRIDAWEKRARQMPASLRAGPLLIIGRARADHRQWESAALVLLEVAILYPQQPRLAGAATVSAVEALEGMGDAQAAQRLMAEYRQRYGEAVPSGTSHTSSSQDNRPERAPSAPPATE